MVASVTSYPTAKWILSYLPGEISSLQQCIEARDGQSVEGLDCIDHLERELQNPSLVLKTQTPSTPAPMERFREMIHQYMDTLCTPQKQTNLTNSLLQDITIFSEHNSTKLEEWLIDIEKNSRSH